MNQNLAKNIRYRKLQIHLKRKNLELLTPIDDFVNFHHEVRIRCELGHIFRRKPDKDRGCPKCSGHSRTTKEFISAVKKLGWHFKSSAYTNAARKHSFACIRCDFSRNIRYDHLRNSPECKCCEKIESQRRKITNNIHRILARKIINNAA